jgi:hypothetical protein
MSAVDERDDLLLFFKALADKSRLRLLGLLAQPNTACRSWQRWRA